MDRFIKNYLSYYSKTELIRFTIEEFKTIIIFNLFTFNGLVF